ncbi:MAG: murein L,D-transpeptidase catalytic domain family protein [bacterium]|nr:murein L,D-transpeptidase catalytic domain family protein [bacterium]
MYKKNNRIMILLFILFNLASINFCSGFTLEIETRFVDHFETGMKDSSQFTLRLDKCYRPGMTGYWLYSLNFKKQNIFFPETVSATAVCHVQRYLRDNNCDDIYAILIDMSMPSDKKRLFIIRLPSEEVIYSTYTAHGRGSGRGRYAKVFSDKKGSLCTTLGRYRVGENYTGTHGDSYKMIGLDESNANAEKRSIVIHSAWYVSEEFARENKRCGNSHGCPAVSEEAFKILKPVLDQKVLIYIYK